MTIPTPRVTRSAICAAIWFVTPAPDSLPDDVATLTAMVIVAQAAFREAQRDAGVRRAQAGTPAAGGASGAEVRRLSRPLDEPVQRWISAQDRLVLRRPARRSLLLTKITSRPKSTKVRS